MKPPRRARCASGWRRTARARCARRATASWTRWGSRSRTSTSIGEWREYDGPTQDRLHGSAGRRHPRQRSRGPAPGGAEPVGCVHDDGDGEAVHLRAGTTCALVRHADGPADCAARRGERQSILIAGDGHHRERRVPEASEEVGSVERILQGARRQTMSFITKTHLSRRTFLHGVGVTMALPLLESMIPAATAFGQTVARPRTRLGVHLLPARRDHAEVDAGAGRRRVRAHRNSSADQAVLRPGQRHQRSAARDGLWQRRDGQPQSVRCRVPERRIRGGRCAAVARHHRRSDRGAEDRPGHAAPLTRADHRRAEPELRRRPELLLSRHDLLAGAARAAAHAEQPAGRVRASVRRRQHGGSSERHAAISRSACSIP